MKEDYPCICGHIKTDHLNPEGIVPGPHDRDSFCDACALDTNRIENWMPAYHNFKGDNLKYLERLSEQVTK